MRSRVMSLACLLAAGLAAPAGAVNTGQDASFVPFVSCAGRVGFRTLELLQGNADRNGDGDALDLDVQILSVPGGGIVDLGIDGGGALACGGDLFAFGVVESNENNTNLNGDADTFDSVLHVYDAGTTTLTNTAVPVTTAIASASLVAFTVSELSANNTDLNGDSDMLDQVLHVFDPASSTVTNVGREAGDGANVKVNGTLVAFVTSEAGQGNTDLNGDGDPLDQVLYLYDASTATLTNTQRAVEPSLGVQLASTVAAFAVNEASQGTLSLNGDADSSDRVLHLYCTPASSCVSSGVVNLAVDASGGFEMAGDLIALGTRERNQAGINLNPPDTDASDTVVQTYRISTNTLTSTGLAMRGRARLDGSLVAVAVPERNQNHTDLNGDGDVRDVVMHLYDTGTSLTTNIQRAVWKKNCPAMPNLTGPKGPCYGIGGDLLLMATSERYQGHTDLNGDGDTRDGVAEAYKISTGVLTNTGLAAANKSAMLVGGTIGAFRVAEKSEGSDLNGDLDTRDNVMVVFDNTTATTTQTGQAAQPLFLIEGNTVVFRENELEQNADLNGDAVLTASVLQFLPF